jgi:N-acetyl-gamma-glutamyl-phosphate reductase
MSNKIRVGIVGGAGYTGGELLRILINHPVVEITFIHSRSNAGNPIYTTHQDLVGETNLVFSDQFDFTVDVIFLCAGHGEAKKFLSENEVPVNVKIIDLSHDFRLEKASTTGNRTFVYGLPELNREKIKQAQNIANPGCFATAIQLGLLPLAQKGLLHEVYTTGITGSTGAGQSLSATSHFSWRANNIQAYKTLQHQHISEIGESLKSLQPDAGKVHFIPWRGDFTRGIFISSQVTTQLNIDELYQLFTAFYASHPFTVVTKEPVFLKQVVNSNKCIISLEKIDDQVVIHSAIDNLLKGASGQAVQNMNLLFNLPETTGLQLKASYF